MAGRQKTVFEQLEPRVLLSGTPMPVDDAAALSVDADSQQTAEANQLVSEILFIDTSVQNYQELLENLKRNVEVVLFDADEDGLDKITSYLKGRQGVTALHLISHGAAGEVQFGSTILNMDSLNSNETQLARWGNALTTDADILIYGCNVAQDEAFVSALADLTGADVAASDDLTGAAKFAGDAELEFQSGALEVDVLLDQQTYNQAEVKLASGVSFDAISGDADSGIDNSKVYTHAIDFGGNTIKPTATVNGVVFADGSPGAFPGTGGGASHTIGTGNSTIPLSYIGNDNADAYLVDGGMEDLVGDLIYNTTTAEINLTGLTGGETYQFRLYHRYFSALSRVQNITFDTDGIAGAEHSASFEQKDATLLDPGFASSTQVYALTYDYTLAVGQTTLKVNIDTVSGASYMLFGLTNEVNPLPTLSSFSSPVDSTNEDEAVEISFAELAAKGDEADANGTVDAFVVKALSSGSLKIGASPSTATAFVTGTNDQIAAGLNAYWLPAADDNGVALSAFTVVAADNYTAESTSAIQVRIDVVPVFDFVPYPYEGESEELKSEALTAESHTASILANQTIFSVLNNAYFDALYFEVEGMDKPQLTPQADLNLPSPIAVDNYDLWLLGPEYQKFIEDLDLERLVDEPSLDMPTEDEGTEENDDEPEQGLFDSTSLDFESVAQTEKLALTQSDLDNSLSLDETLYGEFNCLKI